MNIVIMGVSGSGKSTVGKRLSEGLGLPFFDADDFHPENNVQKMAAGQPLNDKDRKPWLRRLAELIAHENGVVLACSALKKSYRKTLSQGGPITWVFLEGTPELLQKRLAERKGHYMPATLLQSQLDTLEVPEDAIRADISRSPDEIVSSLLETLAH